MFESIVKASPLAIVGIDDEERVNLWNPSAERMFGWLQNEVLRQRVPIDPPELNRQALGIDPSAGLSSAGFDSVRIRKDGVRVPVTVWTTRLDGGLVFTFAEIDQASRPASETLAALNHDIRTPLNTILGFSELLCDETAGALNEKQKRFLTHIRRDASRISDIVDQALNQSKVQSGAL